MAGSAGDTALHYATISRNGLAMLRILLRAGADPLHANAEGCTALQEARVARAPIPPPRVWRFLRSDCASILSEEVACFKCTAGECAHSLGVAGQVEKQEACAALLEHISSALAAARVSPHDHAGRRALPAPPTPLRTPARAQRPQPLPSANVNPFFSCDRTSCGRGACCASAA